MKLALSLALLTLSACSSNPYTNTAVCQSPVGPFIKHNVRISCPRYNSTTCTISEMGGQVATVSPTNCLFLNDKAGGGSEE